MNPVFYIKVAGENITARVQERLASVVLNDQSGMSNDSVVITVDDRDQIVKIPPKGAVVEVSMGYEPKDGHKNPIDLVRRMGIYTVSEINSKKDPNSGLLLSITAKAVYDESGFKVPRRRSYHRLKIHEIVQQCADRAGLKAKVHEDVRDIVVPHIDQEFESDSQFLTTLADKYSCAMTVRDNEILFGPIEKLHEISRLITSEIFVDSSDISSWDWLSQGRGAYSAVTATYKEQGPGVNEPGELKTVSAAGGSFRSGEAIVYAIKNEYPTKEEAQAAALTRMRQFDRALDTLRFSCVGYPSLVSETKVNIRNFRKGIPDQWIATKVTHSFTDDGYKCDVDCEIPKTYEESGGAVGGPENPQ